MALPCHTHAGCRACPGEYLMVPMNPFPWEHLLASLRAALESLYKPLVILGLAVNLEYAYAQIWSLISNCIPESDSANRLGIQQFNN